MMDTGTTFIKCAEAMKNLGALSVNGICVHAVLSGNAIDKLESSDAVNHIYVTDTIPLRRKSQKITVATVADLFAEAIIRTHDNRSISSLYDIER
jgi:ribose-phosphate pyrophosphokinase